MGQVEIRSEFPDEHPQKAAVEAAFREVLGSDAGSWTVVIYLIHGIFWTIFVIRDTDGFRKVMLLDDPKEQKPEFIEACLRGLLEEAHSVGIPDRTHAERHWAPHA